MSKKIVQRIPLPEVAFPSKTMDSLAPLILKNADSTPNSSLTSTQQETVLPLGAIDDEQSIRLMLGGALTSTIVEAILLLITRSLSK